MKLSFQQSIFKIEQWCEHNYPSFVPVYSQGSKQTLDPADPRTRIVLLEQSREQQLVAKRRMGDKRSMGDKAVTTMNGNTVQNRSMEPTELMVYVLGAFGVVIAVSWMIVWVVLKYTE